MLLSSNSMLDTHDIHAPYVWCVDSTRKPHVKRFFRREIPLLKVHISNLSLILLMLTVGVISRKPFVLRWGHNTIHISTMGSCGRQVYFYLPCLICAIGKVKLSRVYVLTIIYLRSEGPQSFVCLLVYYVMTRSNFFSSTCESNIRQYALGESEIFHL